MIHDRPARRRVSTSALTGLLVLGLWTVHSAAPGLPGRAYFPFLVAAALAGVVVWRTGTPLRRRLAGRGGLVAGFACWFAAATLSAILNWHTEQVALTYFLVFLSGAGVFWALCGMTLTPRALDVAIAGLTVGVLFTLVRGLLAFTAEWGTPDVVTAVSAYRDTLRMATYEEATFGNRGNTAGFLMLVAPVLLAMTVDKGKAAVLRILCGTGLLAALATMLILQVRAAFLTMLVASLVVWAFKRGARWLPLVPVVAVVGCLLLFKYEPDAGWMMSERIAAAATLDVTGDSSIQGRTESVRIGWEIFADHWLLGIGPGAALTLHPYSSAHQFHTQQAMETGILGLLGATLFSIGIWICLVRTLARGRGDEVNDMRFLLLIGPASFITYALVANAAFNSGSVNTWTVLIASMLALMPAFEPHMRRRRLVCRA